jgi:pimeloyl-ACP methyl ester carboxylesterase
MTLPDGRRLAYQAIGAKGSAAALVLHGTPRSSRQLAGLDPARDRGLALIVPDRAGYGRSGFDPSRTIASGARDLGELIRHLGLTEDRNVPVGHARVIAAACPAARLHIVEGGGHMLLSQLDQIIEGLAPHQE